MALPLHDCVYMLALGWFPVGLGLVVEGELSKHSCLAVCDEYSNEM